MEHVRADRWRQRCWRSNQRDLRAHIKGGLRKSISLFAGGAIGDHTHGVEWLLSPTSGDHDFLVSERSIASENETNVTDDLSGFEHSSYPGESRGEMSLCRT